MAAFGGLILTNKGRNVLAKAQTGKKLKIIKVVIGDGKLGTTESIVNLTNLKNKIASFNIMDIKITQDKIAKIVFVFNNKEIESGFYWREIGVIVEEPDTKEEVLYCYGNAGDNGDYIAQGGGEDALEKYVNVDIIIENTSNVSAVINDSLIFASKQEFLDLQEEVKINKIFKWDGKSSTDNSKNIELFQEIVDYVKEGNTADIISQTVKEVPTASVTYSIKDLKSGQINAFYCKYETAETHHNSYSTYSNREKRLGIRLNAEGKVTEINTSEIGNAGSDYLDTNFDYPSPYMPEFEGSPATKKYVDTLLHKYRLEITQTISDNSEVTLPFYYKVGNDSLLQVSLNGEILIKATDTEDGHYKEVGTVGSASNKIKIHEWGCSADSRRCI